MSAHRRHRACSRTFGPQHRTHALGVARAVSILVRDQLCVHNPCLDVRAPRSPKRLPAALSPDEARRLVEIAGEDVLAVRDRAMLELLYSSGLRLSELAALTGRCSTSPTARAGRAARAQDAGRAGRPSGACRACSRGANAGASSSATDDETPCSSIARGKRLSTRMIQVRVRRAGINRASPRACTRTSCATRSRRTCCNRAAICAPCRRCWGMPASRPRRCIRTSTSSTSRRCTTPRIRGRSERAEVIDRRRGADRTQTRPREIAAAPASLDILGRDRAGARRPRAGRNGGGHSTAGRVSRPRRLQSALADPRTRLELRRKCKDRRRVHAMRHRACDRVSCARGRADIDAVPPGPRRVATASGAGDRSLRRYGGDAMLQRRRRMLARRLCRRTDRSRRLPCVYSSARMPRTRSLEGLDARCRHRARRRAARDDRGARRRGARFWSTCVDGQKTGFFVDQRDNRATRGQAARGREVLDVFCYSGGFSDCGAARRCGQRRRRSTARL